MLGFSHTTAKYIHAFLQTSAMILAILGVITMHMHMDTWSEDHWGSTHALVGLMMVVLWSMQVVLSLLIFLTPCAPGWLKGAYHQLHMALGYCFSFGMLVVIIMGIVYEEVALDTLPGGSETIWENIWEKMRPAVIAVFFLAFAMYLALYRRPEARN